MSNKLTKHVYHYTSWNALKGIIINREIWGGNTGEMKDENEILYYPKLLENALKRDLSSHYHEAVSDYFDKLISRAKSEYPFAVSFSMRREDISQWERYGEGCKGLCLTFDRENLEKIFNTNIAKLPFLLSRVFYTNHIRNHPHYQGLKSFFETGRDPDFWSEEGRQDNILLCSAIHKSPPYLPEKEYRLVSLWRRKSSFFHIKVERETINGEERSFMKLPLEKLCKANEIDFEDLIVEITMGSCSKKSEQELSEFLRSYGCYRLSKQIKRSICTIRQGTDYGTN